MIGPKYIEYLYVFIVKHKYHIDDLLKLINGMNKNDFYTRFICLINLFKN